MIPGYKTKTMKNQHLYLIAFIISILLFSCSKDEILPEDNYYNTLSFQDSSLVHPKAHIYQNLLDNFVEGGGIGMSVMIRDPYGTWLGAAGYADIVSGIPLQSSHRFHIASISKTFTAAAAFLLMEEGLFTLDDPVNQWIDQKICDRIDNANESKVEDLIGHNSSIRDIYTSNHLIPYLNRRHNNWMDKDMLEFVFGKNAYFDVGKWQYSNVNYILLGMIMEEASGLTLKQIYEQKIFEPLGLESAFYGIGNDRVAPGAVKGYSDIFSNNTFIEARDVYEDDFGVGGDGGIAINSQDLGMFMDQLMAGNLVSESSLAKMTDWFEGGYSTEGKAGYGLYYEEYEYGPTIGHGGGVIGWEASMDYFSDHDVTLVKMTNTDLILTTDEYDDNFNSFSINLKKAIFDIE